MLRLLSKQWCGIFGSSPPENKHDNVRVVIRRFRWTVFTISIAQTLRQTDRGRFFLHDLRTMVPLNIEDEVQYWNARNVSLWRVLFGNWDQIGLTNSITIVSALGTEFTMTVSTVPQKSRTSTVTTNTMFTSMYVDMFFAQNMNASLVASDPSFLWKNASLLQGWDAGTSIVFNAFGPLYTIDLYLMSPPNFLVELVQVLSILTLEKRWRVESTAALLDDILPFEICKPKVQAWNKVQSILAFISGSPLCPSFDQTTDYLLQEWGFDNKSSKFTLCHLCLNLQIVLLVPVEFSGL
ncbi:hypothetical protein AeRB84_018013 [Aphanomyces euteiches]|nr:hypothetical protein AeRB84_018013 [Aphanomyces euteiches]